MKAITVADLERLCPEGHAELQRQSADPDFEGSPLEDCEFFVDELTGEFSMQDPGDEGFSTGALIWDGEMWG